MLLFHFSRSKCHPTREQWTFWIGPTKTTYSREQLDYAARVKHSTLALNRWISETNLFERINYTGASCAHKIVADPTNNNYSIVSASFSLPSLPNVHFKIVSSFHFERNFNWTWTSFGTAVDPFLCKIDCNMRRIRIENGAALADWLAGWLCRVGRRETIKCWNNKCTRTSTRVHTRHTTNGKHLNSYLFAFGLFLLSFVFN